MKNSASNITRATRSLKSNLRWLVTGTPLNTDVSDLYGMLYSLRVFGLHHKSLFDAVVAYPGSDFFNRGDDDKFPPTLSYLMSKLMIRHEKQQMFGSPPRKLLELPKKTTTRVIVEWGEGAEGKRRKAEYDAIEKATLDRGVRSLLSSEGISKKYYMRLYQRLQMLLRYCSVGYVDEEDDDAASALASNSGNASSASAPAAASKTTGTESKTKRKREDPSKFPKIRRALKTLKDIRRMDRTAKVLVFSHFSQTLDAFQTALRSEDIGFATLDGSMTGGVRNRNLKRFEEDDDTVAFLLSVRAGAVGINLTQANHVFLMDPCWNPALEQQAVGRSWRMGQKRQVHVHRFVMKSSADSRLVDFDLR